MSFKIRNAKRIKLQGVKHSDGYMCHPNKKSCSEPKCAHPCCLTNILEILDFCQQLFLLEKIPFFITHKSLFSFNKQNLIDTGHDNIDTMSLASDADLIESFRPQFEKIGYILRRNKGKNNFEYDYFTVVYSQSNNNYIDIYLLNSIDTNYFISIDTI